MVLSKHEYNVLSNKDVGNVFFIVYLELEQSPVSTIVNMRKNNHPKPNDMFMSYDFSELSLISICIRMNVFCNEMYLQTLLRSYKVHQPFMQSGFRSNDL